MEVACLRPRLYATGCEETKVEAEKPVPQLGTLGRVEQWRNRLPHKQQGGSLL